MEWATDEAYMNLHSIHNLNTFKHDIAVITQEEDIAKKTLMSVLKGRFKIETMIKIVEAENPNITWLKRHHNAMDALSQANKHTQQLINEAGLKEKNCEQRQRALEQDVTPSPKRNPSKLQKTFTYKIVKSSNDHQNLRIVLSLSQTTLTHYILRAY